MCMFFPKDDFCLKWARVQLAMKREAKKRIRLQKVPPHLIIPCAMRVICSLAVASG